MEESDFTVIEYIEMLKQMPPDAKLSIKYTGYYEAYGGPDKPYLDKNGTVVIGEVSANY